MSRQAAGVLIYKDGLVLAINRSDGRGYGFPCGGVEPLELLQEAAVRECYEETGHIACIANSDKYIEAFETVTVSIFRATTVAQTQPTHPEEGTTEWITPRTLVTKSPWNEYNRQVFKHFCIPI